MRLLILSICLGAILPAATAQLTVTIRVEGAAIETDCTDLFSDPDLMYSVRIAGQAPVLYDPAWSGGCFTAAPTIQYTELIDGSCNLPASIEVCFDIFENDGIILPCAVFPSCLESLCQTISLPAAGSSSSDTIRILTGSSRGELYLTLQTAEDPNDFNYLCGAVDLGLLAYGSLLGDTLQTYDNNCADALNEINPVDINVNLFNNHGVWFRYTTDAEVSPMQLIQVFSDPLGTGDLLDAELMVFSADSCTASLQRFPLYVTNNTGNDAQIRLYCPLPNTTYYILIDGAGGEDTQQGTFSLVVVDPGLPRGGDLRCEADDLGAVPEGGQVSSPTAVGNFCAGFSDDPFVRNFISRNSVWFSFVAPPSGHIAVEAVSSNFGPIDLELALYASSNDSCTGFYTHLYSGRDPSSFDESFTFSCLDPGRPYWVLVDGAGQSSQGYFTILVRDLGDIRPVTMQDTTICSTGSVQVGTMIYNQSGYYIDTLKIPGGNCDSIVITDLTVLAPLQLQLNQTRPAIGLGGSDGEATASISGGSGNYTISWCGGPFEPLGPGGVATNNNLVAGTNCCVVLRDDIGCQTDSCFVVDFVPPLLPFGRTDSVLCHGDSTGSLLLGILGGRAPYVYSWSNETQSLGGLGVLLTAGDSVRVNNLPAGTYRITLADQFFNDTIFLRVEEPAPLLFSIASQQPISCYQACDASFVLDFGGGVGGYSMDTIAPAGGYGCAGNYRFVLRDANGCERHVEANVVEPLPFLLFAAVEGVTCFDGEDGQIRITSNGSPISYEWSQGATTADLVGLAAGVYTVLVTNSDGCTASLSATIEQPASPLSLRIDEMNPIRCAATEDGQLAALASGGGGNLSYTWSDGQNTALATQLGPAIYSLTVTDANGCQAVASYQLEAPPILTARASSRAIRCPDAANAGAIRVETVAGGLPPYLFALGDGGFSADSLFTGLTAGSYDLAVEDALGCVFRLAVLVAPPPVLLADLGGDRTVLLGDSVWLQLATNSQDLVYNWSIDPLLQAPATYFRPQRTMEVRLSIRDTITDCEASSQIQLLVDRQPRYYIPTAFSPNGDGVNDLFFPFGGSDVLQVSDFRIFNRFGGEVFSLVAPFAPNRPDLGWDGQVRGQKAASGLYVYTARLTFFDGREEIAKGEVNLLR